MNIFARSFSVFLLGMGAAASAAGKEELLNVSYDPTRELNRVWNDSI